MKTLIFNEHYVVIRHILCFGKLLYPDIKQMTSYLVYIQVGHLYLTKNFETEELAEYERNRIEDLVDRCNE